MQINIQIQLGPDDDLPVATPREMLKQLGFDPEKDSIGVSIGAGYSPPPPPTTPPVEPASASAIKSSK